MNETTQLIEARRLTKVYGAGRTEVRAVDGVDLALPSGELVLIMGPSGSGKTTLLSMLGGLLGPTSGEVLVDGQDLAALPEAKKAAVRAHRFGFIFQAFNLLSSLSAVDNVAFPAKLVGTDRHQARDRARSLLDRLQLGDRAHALPRDLSGGEKQRVAIARALINDPALILADEPTGNLDSRRGHEVAMILHDLTRDEGRSVLIVTHDPRLEEIADRILWLEDGQLRDRREESHEWLRDPVCGMQVDAWETPFATERDGQRHVFCSERCLSRFEEDPARYAGSPGRARHA